MDPHSTRSQFNQRPPKAGPASHNQRHFDLTSIPPKSSPLDGFTKRSQSTSSSSLASLKSITSKGISSSSTSSTQTPRRIATNSRIKQDEQLRKDMHLAFVNNALQQKAMGNTETFDELVDQFNLDNRTPDAPSALPALRIWLQALMHVVSRLERCHTPLVEAIVRLPWMTMENSFVKCYTSFIGILISARPEYLSLVLGKVAQGFTYQSGLQALNVSPPESSSAPLTRRTVYDRIHTLLQHLLSLVPTLPSTLQPLLVRHFPHKRQNQAAQVTYIRNMLRVTEYCPELADRLMETIVDRAIQIDVEIQVEIEELEAEASARSQAQDQLFDLDPFDTVVGQEGTVLDSDSDAGGDDEGDEGGGNLSDISSEAEDPDEVGEEKYMDVDHIQEMVRKLDAVMKLIFEHFERMRTSCTATAPSEPSLPTTATADPNTLPPPTSSVSLPPTPPPPTDQAQAQAQILLRTTFHTLLSIFDRTILLTFKSRYTQFLLFYLTSLDPEFADTFTGELVHKALFSPELPVVTRAASASYVASFVSRARFVGRGWTREVVGLMGRWLRGQVEGHEMMMVGLEVGVQGLAPLNVFYAVAQALLLIFCFRWRDLLEEEEEDGENGDADVDAEGPSGGRKWMEELGIVQRMVTCSLNPLKFCSENVVIQFARVAQAAGFVYVYPIIEANRRHEFTPSLPSSSSSTFPSNSTNTNTAAAHAPNQHLHHLQSNAHRPRETNAHRHSEMRGSGGGGSNGGLAGAMPAYLARHAEQNANVLGDLNTFFPFDPYKLPRSAGYVESGYREWGEVAIEDDDDDEDSDAEEEVEVDELEEEGEGGVPMSLGGMGVNISGGKKEVEVEVEAQAMELGASFGGMSISPAPAMGLVDRSR